ncbi:MAG: pyruvate:ferredoxin (flavodoxin) oxidoreductase [Heliobacteriaceae bacterium]|nr:pyruvate:ferredoxin (flavodoxin) oxidoreductase [Heliobacteriaceae bacterium]MDD4588625.1 pyruvate:ferredoxin (flavodoxin) oxidoreductase [Heliobacteriaceae bacterium]
MAPQFKTIDGNEAAAYISYPFTEVAAIYPITPSSPMAENVDKWAAAGRQNLFGQPVKIVEMQSEAGAAGAVHGALAAGVLSTTYTASQGLLLMIPNMYKLAGELLPAVLHVSARAVATHALSIFGDHQDVMACRQTGVALLAAASVQEVMDLGLVAHLAAIKSRIPFLHFFDGFRTSHELQKIAVIDYADLTGLVDFAAIEAFRRRALNPEHPVVRGTAQNPDIYFQGREAANPYYAACPEIVAQCMADVARITGRHYHLFDYYGVSDAERVIVTMGSVGETAEAVVDYLAGRGEKVGAVRVRLYRPFSAEHLLRVLPGTVRWIAVLDRTKEPGATAQPLHLDIVKVFSQAGRQPLIVGGRYGLGGKDTTPAQIIAVFENLKAAQPQDNFTIGIVDDVTRTSLPVKDYPAGDRATGTINCKFWGLGSDGTVGANKMAVKIIGDHTDFYVQGYFAYDSKKSGGTTVSHIRFGPQPVKAPYLIDAADYIACHNYAYLYHYDLLKGLKENGVFVLNCPWDEAELAQEIPAAIKRYIARNNIAFYIIDAVAIAQAIGLGSRINMIMQAAFFKVVNVIPVDQAADLLKKALATVYGAKGPQVVQMNQAAVDRGIAGIKRVTVPQEWRDVPVEDRPAGDEPEFVARIQVPMARQDGDDLPVSAFADRADGSFPLGTTAYEKRGIAVRIPEWQLEKCIQCNQCSYICPHAVVRPFLADEEELKGAPATFRTKKAVGKGLQGLGYRIQISPLDCTGCGNCADICPAPGKALVMQPAEEQTAAQALNWEFALTLSPKAGRVAITTVKGSQFVPPLFEFNGACPGCGETPYIRLLTQLFGDRMLIANATGCSSIYGASAPSIPYTTNRAGEGPAWANSLFEDNAEYGYGMFLGVRQIRNRLAGLMRQAIAGPLDERLKQAFLSWLARMDDSAGSKEAAAGILAAIAANEPAGGNPLVTAILAQKDYLVKKSHWLIGGDGWAYDIGYGGLDHVLALGDDVNVLVLDTEVYSNTGGQSSKSTPTAAVAKFATAGKKVRKKDLGRMVMSYGYVYVAQIAIGADMAQTIRAFTEAEGYAGPSLIIAYAPCVNHGIKTGMGTSIAREKKAVAAGYWHLYRYNPVLSEAGKNPFILDSPEPQASLAEFLQGETRYTSLGYTFPGQAEKLAAQAEKRARERYAKYRRLAETDISPPLQ